MESISKCLKEWNAMVESLCQGKQTILIRNYKTNITEFLLSPTVNYALKNDYLESFQGKYHDFELSNSRQIRKGIKFSLNTSLVWIVSYRNQSQGYPQINITSGPEIM